MRRTLCVQASTCSATGNIGSNMQAAHLCTCARIVASTAPVATRVLYARQLLLCPLVETSLSRRARNASSYVSHNGHVAFVGCALFRHSFMPSEWRRFLACPSTTIATDCSGGCGCTSPERNIYSHRVRIECCPYRPRHCHRSDHACCTRRRRHFGCRHPCERWGLRSCMAHVPAGAPGCRHQAPQRTHRHCTARRLPRRPRCFHRTARRPHHRERCSHHPHPHAVCPGAVTRNVLSAYHRNDHRCRYRVPHYIARLL